MFKAISQHHKIGASASGTQTYFQKHSLSVAPRQLSRTGWLVSPIGFGGYRIHDRNPEHRDALRLALTSGCNLIDTSTNYTDGGSELLIGQVLQELFKKGEISRDQIVVVTKVGYLQGDNLTIAQRKIEEGSPFPEVVEFSDDCWHCISPEFIEDQISRSLQRLGIEQIDVLLLHNPEYFLKAGGHHQEYYERIRKAFEFLETQVEAGKIQYYGISSNTFPSEKESSDFTSFESVLEIACSIRQDHHFAVIQFPFNLLEPGAALNPIFLGKTLLDFARAENFGTLINRPLNSFSHDRLVRLVDFPEKETHQATEELQSALNESLTIEAEYKGSLPLKRFAWGHIIHHNFNALANLENWKYFLNQQAGPAIKELTTNPLFEKDPWLVRYIPAAERLFSAMSDYVQSVCHSDCSRIKNKLLSTVPELATSKSLSQIAVRIYRSIPEITSILAGIREPAYVQDLLDFEPEISKEAAFLAIETVEKLK